MTFGRVRKIPLIFNRFGAKFRLLGVWLTISFFSSCIHNEHELWKSEYLYMESFEEIYIQRYDTINQYLLLYENGEALLIDSLPNKVRRSQTSWFIQVKNGDSIFCLDCESANSMLMPIAYEIYVKDSETFEMGFDSTNSAGTSKHIWKLKRVYD